MRSEKVEIEVRLAMRILAITLAAVLVAFIGTQAPQWLGPHELGQSADCRADGTCP